MGVEGWIGADEMNALSVHLTEDFQVITQVEFVH